MTDPAVHCLLCRNNAAGVGLPPRERVFDDGLWRVAHAFDSKLPGWLVALPHRHVTALAALTPAEAEALGPLLRRLSAALEAVTGCVKTYVMLFAEADGLAHLHVHVVPRRPDIPTERRGPAVFGYLAECERHAIPATEPDRIAERLAVALTTDG